MSEQASPSSSGSPENNVNQRNDQVIEMPQMNRRYPQRARNRYGEDTFLKRGNYVACTVLHSSYVFCILV